jgi:hypothetical protein
MITAAISNYLSTIGRKGGSTTTPAKAKAARANAIIGCKKRRENKGKTKKTK